MENGDRFIIVGNILSATDVQNLQTEGRVCIDTEKNEIAVEISRELLMAAVEQLKEYA